MTSARSTSVTENTFDNRLRLDNAADNAILILQYYLLRVRFTRVYGIEEISHVNQNYPYVHHPIENHKYICLPARSLTNKFLTEMRVSLVIVTMKNINEISKSAPENLTLFELADRLSKIRTILSTAAAQNDVLSSDHKKRHCTFKQAVGNSNYTSGYFSSLWKFTFFQSRASKALEKSIEAIDNVTNEFTFKLGRVS
jgi:hypothetical protein